MPTNEEFITTLFGVDAPWAHVTDFTYDPNNIPDDQHLKCWRGDYYSRYRFTEGSNQYFTISTFYTDQKGHARRRKALYRQTHVIVLDDVKEKLSLEQVKLLPEPTWVLETSPGSEQWGYLLNEPCTQRHRVENLLDGLVANGLAPEGRDPGMKGVTRYVRLPEGYNTKADKMINGQPYKCQMLTWAPFNTVSMEQLAQPFAVNLDAVRREQRVDGAATVNDHPLLSIPDLIHIKEERSDGRFDITCPWVDEHTGSVDNGSAIFTNADGSIGFKCHHGACQSRTGRDLLKVIEEDAPGFGSQLKSWQLHHSFKQIVPPVPIPTQMPGSKANIPPIEPPFKSALPDTPEASLPVDEGVGPFVAKLRVTPFGTPEAMAMAAEILKVVDTMAAMEKLYWHEQLRDIMRWSKTELKSILQNLREEWYVNSTGEVNFFDEVVFVRELNQFYDRKKRMFYSPEAYQNSYANLDPEVRKSALQGGMVTKVDKLDYAPLMPAVFTQGSKGSTVYANSWFDSGSQGVPGDISRYLDHFVHLGWGPNRSHVLKWMAFTIRHPDQKINHMLLFGSGEGCGKDWLLFPLVKAMGDNHMTIDGEELLSGFHDYALSTKHLHINEAELGDRREAQAIAAKIKPLAAAPPDMLRVNQKNIKPIRVRNVLSVTMTTNSQLPFRLTSQSRRIYALWSDLVIRDDYGEVLPEWSAYWKDRWHWMRNGGAEAVIHYLRHQVDLSNFDPGEAPPMTDFLRDMQEASKSPMQQTIESFMLRRIGCFASDIVSSADISETIKGGVITNNDLVYCDSKLFTPIKVTQLMQQISGVRRSRMRAGKKDVHGWIIRNHEAYKNMSQVELMQEYDAQMKKARDNIVPLMRVK